MKRTLLFTTLMLAAPIVGTTGLDRLLAGHDWAAIAAGPQALAQQVQDQPGLDCRLQRYPGGQTLDCLAKAPLPALGMRVKEFYLSQDTAGTHTLKMVFPASAAAVEQRAAAHYRGAFVSAGADRWRMTLPTAGRTIAISQREDRMGELAYILRGQPAAAAQMAGATAATGVLRGAIAAGAALPPLQVCAIPATAGAARCVARAADASRYAITGLAPGRYWVIGYPAQGDVHPAHAMEFGHCRAGSDCPNGLLRALPVRAGEVVRADLNHRFERLPSALAQLPQTTRRV